METIAPPIAERRAEPVSELGFVLFLLDRLKRLPVLKILTCIQVIHMNKIRGWFESFKFLIIRRWAV
jgi:hypothetical protein